MLGKWVISLLLLNVLVVVQEGLSLRNPDNIYSNAVLLIFICGLVDLVQCDGAFVVIMSVCYKDLNVLIFAVFFFLFLVFF